MGIVNVLALILSDSKEHEINFKNTPNSTTEFTVLFMAAKQGLVLVVAMQ
jgi:hypothetical protein